MAVLERVGITRGISTLIQLHQDLSGAEISEAQHKEIQNKKYWLKVDIEMEGVIGVMTTLEILVCLLLAEETLVVGILLTGFLLVMLDWVTKIDATKLQELMQNIDAPDIEEID